MVSRYFIGRRAFFISVPPSLLLIARLVDEVLTPTYACNLSGGGSRFSNTLTCKAFPCHAKWTSGTNNVPGAFPAEAFIHESAQDALPGV